MKENKSDTIYKHVYNYASHEGFAYLRSEEKHYLFFEPVAKIWADENGSYLHTKNQTKEFPGIWDAFEEQSSAVNNDSPLPMMAGYFSYELCHALEDIKEVKEYTVENYLYEFFIYNKVLLIQGASERLHSHNLNFDAFWKYTVPSEQFPEFELRESDTTLTEIEENFAKYSNFTKEHYQKSVSQIIEYIKHGDVYQVNLSQQFRLPYHRPAYDFFYALSETSPAIFASFINTGNRHVISSSPERFLRYDKNRLYTSPIKGTKLRLQNDENEIASLRNSEKELSELTMIVDIERNDLSKVASPNSVKVERHARVDSITQVHHLVSDISCELRKEAGLTDVVRAMFPSGSITGAPKIAAMNIIAELEGTNRGVYTGSIGWLAGDGTYDFNIAIRTAMIEKDQIIFSAGGGVVYDSSPTDEFYETLAKTKGFYLAYSSLFSDN